MPLLRPSTGSLLLRPLPWAVVLGYFAVFLLLDWASFIRPLQGLNITPWNPQPALAVALLLARRNLWWVVLAGLLAAEVLVRSVPGPAPVVALVAAGLTCSYLAIAAALQRVLREGRRLAGPREVAAFLAVIAVGSVVSAVLYVGTYTVGGFRPEGSWLGAVARYWVGDAVGLTVTLPILLVAMDEDGRRRLRETLTRPGAWGVGGMIVGLLALLFGDGGDGFDFSYLLLLPVIWAAMRSGAAGAVLACAATQLGLIAATQAVGHKDLLVFELQLLMATITTTALLLGVVVDQRARADADLRRTLRMAAAGQMTAALAHELSQPLHALTLRAQSFELLAAATGPLEASRREQLAGLASSLSADARRAAEVVRRLRDFFRTGTTQLETVDVGRLVDEALQAQRGRAQADGAALDARVDPDLPTVFADPVQLQVVLRNLLANALDAVQQQPPGARRAVEVRATGHGDELLIEVLDSGRGLDASQSLAVFDGTGSGKAGGMGVGLGICRAIVEAHGGRLWSVPGTRGHFCLALARDHDEPREADADAA